MLNHHFFWLQNRELTNKQKGKIKRKKKQILIKSDESCKFSAKCFETRLVCVAKFKYRIFDILFTPNNIRSERKLQFRLFAPQRKGKKSDKMLDRIRTKRKSD